MNFIANPSTLAKVDRELKLNAEALRWLVVKRSAKLPPATAADAAAPSAQGIIDVKQQ